ncbi:hypothetical protein CEP53_004203 [Fusarium sp. AF-6]|nr:hypothetical protein CEP53_004203 [Fusarium sp. AF-6]
MDFVCWFITSVISNRFKTQYHFNLGKRCSKPTCIKRSRILHETTAPDLLNTLGWPCRRGNRTIEAPSSSSSSRTQLPSLGLASTDFLPTGTTQQ